MIITFVTEESQQKYFKQTLILVQNLINSFNKAKNIKHYKLLSFF